MKAAVSTAEKSAIEMVERKGEKWGGLVEYKWVD